MLYSDKNRDRAVQLANARRAERGLGPTSWTEMSDGGRAHYLCQALLLTRPTAPQRIAA